MQSGSAATDDLVHAASAYTRYPHPNLKITGAGTAYTLHRDHLASVRLVTAVQKWRYRITDLVIRFLTEAVWGLTST